MTERRERKEVPAQESTIEITGRVKLGPKDNFFKQYPFDDILTAAVGPTPDKPAKKRLRSDLAHLVSAFAKFVENGRSTPIKKKRAVEFFTKIVSNLPEDRQRYFPEGKKREALKTHLQQIVMTLKPFPGWRTYVRGQQEELIYKLNGDPRWSQAKTPEESLPKTYLAWVEEYLSTQEQIRAGFTVQTVLEAFPQQSGGDQDMRDIMRRWKITRLRGLHK